MPFSDSGLWIPREPPKKKSWRTGVTLPLVVSIISVALSSGIAWFGLRLTRINTKLAQRAYLGYKVELAYQPSFPYNLGYRIILTNLGNTPADTIEVRPAEFDELLNMHVPPGTQLPRKVKNVFSKAPYFSPTDPFDFQLGPKETVAVDGFAILPPKSFIGVTIMGKIIYFDVFGDFHKQYYCTELTTPDSKPLTPTTPGIFSLVGYQFKDCQMFSREEVIPGPLLPTPWNKESVSKEYDK